jgi:hypothetical protein
MAKWYAVSSEIRFKPVLDGYVFQSPASRATVVITS